MYMYVCYLHTCTLHAHVTPTEPVVVSDVVVVLQWMRAHWKSDACYAKLGVDGSDCSFQVYLSEVSCSTLREVVPYLSEVSCSTLREVVPYLSEGSGLYPQGGCSLRQ